MAAIALERIGKRFGTTVVADDLSLAIDDGEFFVFLGPSGGGKSTLLHMIAGVEPPTSGRIRIGEVDVTDLPPQKRDVAMVFQSYALYPHLDVAENLAFPLRNRGMSRQAAHARALRVASTLGIEQLLHRRPRELSGGQRQRVALGRALIRAPAAFLMDEPLSNVDAALRLEIREEIKRVHQAHRITTVFVTHDQEEALALADRVAVLKDGRVQQCAPPAEIYARPANTFVARFVGTPPMNLLPATALARLPAVHERLAGRDASAVVIGVRPHAIRMRRAAADAPVSFAVRLVEPAGPETWIVAGDDISRLKGRIATDTVLALAEAVQVDFAPDDVHLFDAQTGARLD
jgi:multiple sugar transport system ATP-binding protein